MKDQKCPCPNYRLPFPHVQTAVVANDHYCSNEHVFSLSLNLSMICSFALKMRKAKVTVYDCYMIVASLSNYSDRKEAHF